MKLYLNTPANLFGQTALVCADLAGVPVQVEYKDKAAANEKEFKAKHLTGKFPLLETAEGDLLFESTAIATHFIRHAPNSGLYGQTLFQQAQCDEWIAFTQCTLSK